MQFERLRGQPCNCTKNTHTQKKTSKTTQNVHTKAHTIKHLLILYFKNKNERRTDEETLEEKTVTRDQSKLMTDAERTERLSVFLNQRK